MNKVELTGKLTKNAELKYTSTNKAITKINIYEEDAKTFLDIILWEQVAEIAKDFKKDDIIKIIGIVRKRSYEDKDKKKIYITEITASECSLLEESTTEYVSPYDFENKQQEEDPFKDFGDSLVIDDNFLD